MVGYPLQRQLGFLFYFSLCQNVRRALNSVVWSFLCSVDMPSVQWITGLGLHVSSPMMIDDPRFATVLSPGDGATAMYGA